jgi:hypothetical protein
MLTCSKCHRVIIPDYDTYTTNEDGEFFHKRHEGNRKFLIAFILLLAIAIAAVARGDPRYVSMSCKGAVGAMANGFRAEGVRCVGIDIERFVPRWTAIDEADPSQPSYTSNQGTFFFPASDRWMIVELQLDSEAETTYLRARVRRVRGKPEMTNYP